MEEDDAEGADEEATTEEDATTTAGRWYVESRLGPGKQQSGQKEAEEKFAVLKTDLHRFDRGLRRMAERKKKEEKREVSFPLRSKEENTGDLPCCTPTPELRQIR